MRAIASTARPIVHSLATVWSRRCRTRRKCSRSAASARSWRRTRRPGWRWSKPNVRPVLVDDFATDRQRLGRFLDLANLIKVSDEDLRSLDAGKSIEAHAAELLQRPNCELVIVTLGERGSRAFTASASAEGGIFAARVPGGDTVGAGDSLMAGVLTTLSERGLLQPGQLRGLGSDELAEVLRFGAIVAGLNCEHKGCVPPTRSEVDAILNAAD